MYGSKKWDTKKQMQCQKSSKQTKTIRKIISTWVIFINKYLLFESWFTDSFTEVLLWQKPQSNDEAKTISNMSNPTKFTNRHQYQRYINRLRKLILLLVLGDQKPSAHEAPLPFSIALFIAVFGRKRLVDRCFEAKPNMKKWERHLPVVRLNGL
jgi:hypothetical protein